MDQFTGHYDAWTESRLAWIAGMFGDDVFRGATVLDIGGGGGHVARAVMDMGAASVEVVEGRLHNIAGAEATPGVSFTHANLERALVSSRDSYDVVLNFGTIYHLANWEPMLVRSIQLARHFAFVETEVVDSDTEHNRYVIEVEADYDQAMSGVASRPSEFEIDRIFDRIPNADARKILDASLNAEFHQYDWRNELGGRVVDGQRRFWSVVRTSDVDPAVERAAVEALLEELHRLKVVDTLLVTRRELDTLERKLDAVVEAVAYLVDRTRPAEPPPPAA